MSETSPAYVGSGIDWEQKNKMDMAQQLAEFAINAAQQKANDEAQKRDILQQWLNPPQNFYGQSDTPVQMGTMAVQSPETGNMGPTQRVGIGPMGVIPAGEATSAGPQLQAEQQNKKGKAERIMLGLPEESPEDKRAAEFEKMRELERERDERQQIYLDAREKREQAKIDALALQSEKNQAAKDKHGFVQGIDAEIRQLQGKQLDEVSRYNIEYAKAINDKTREFLVGERDKVNTRLQQQIDDLRLQKTKVIDPEGYHQQMLFRKDQEDKAAYVQKVAMEADALPFLEKKMFSELAAKRGLDSKNVDIYDVAQTIDEAKRAAADEKDKRWGLYESGLNDEMIDRLQNPKTFNDAIAQATLPDSALSMAMGGIAIPAGGGAMLRSIFGGGKPPAATAAKTAAKAAIKGAFKSSTVSPLESNAPGWKPIPTVEPGWVDIPMGPTTPGPIRGMLPSSTAIAARGTLPASTPPVAAMDQIVRQLSGLYKKNPTPQVREALGRIHALRMESQGFRKIDPDVMKILEERSGL